MEPKKLRLLLIVGIAAMVISVVCFISVSALMQSVNERKSRLDRADAVIGDLTWDEILATSSENRDQTAEPSEGAAAVSPEASGQGAAAPASSASSAPSRGSSASAATSARPAGSASAAASGSGAPGASSSAAATLAPGARPTVFIGGGLVPYDDRKFQISLNGVPEAGFAKVITITREGQVMRAQDISWEVDVPDSDDVHITMKGQRLSDKDTIGTGALVELYDDGKIVDTAVVVLPGDVIGTGTVDSAQIAALERAVSNPDMLKGAYFLAGDLDRSGKIDQADVALLRERIKE